ncbi:hypothetical protein JHK82_054482 [Glycine max]|nr:hypothetical protein JHK86_054333 [Glycine max]KAG4916833.1 hypothetical protein JHK87_054390 [Glycine soja]KAG4928803.1 hypothetical protein JHK85_055289 [Glycine max]KAG5084314.1 hypothetical protein JHK84_054352 [Glycine max]KAG5087085.1 hypothetical protein JHK82_054482 [Glycine max]
MKSKTFCRVVKKKSTENYKGAPYITTFLCTSLWTSYGVLKPGGFQIAIVNGAGAVFHCTYIILFLVYSPQDQKVKTALWVAILDVGFLGTVISVTLFALHGTIQLSVLGMFCSGLTIIMYASPLLSMIPNLIGLILGSTQLTVYVVYKKKQPEATKGPRVGLSLGKGASNYEEAQLKDETVKVVVVEKALKKVKSLPKPVLNHEHILKKTLSFGVNNLPSTFWSTKPQQEDVAVDAEEAQV